MTNPASPPSTLTGRKATRGMRNRRFQVDVCEDCLSRPIADVLAFCAGGHAGEVTPASKRGVVRIADG